MSKPNPLRLLRTAIPPRNRAACRARNASNWSSSFLNPGKWFTASSGPLQAQHVGEGDIAVPVEDVNVTHVANAGNMRTSSSPIQSMHVAPMHNPPSGSTSIPSPSPAPTAASSFTTINASEISHFSRLSQHWWNEKGEFGLLHKMNPVRVEFVREKVLRGKEDDKGWTFEGRPSRKIRDGGEDVGEGEGGRWLEGMDVLDVGCGGGLLSESLARLGGNTLAIDASQANINIARIHASQDPFLPYRPPTLSSDPLNTSTEHSSPSYVPGSLTYEAIPAEELMKRGRKFDLVCSMEVVEHVDEPGEFLKTLGEMVKPGGHLVLSTISRTPLSQLLTITLAEHVLRLVTPGTHTYSKFIKPDELLAFVRDEMGGPAVWESDGDGLVNGGRGEEGRGGLTAGEVRGIVYDPVGGKWRLWPRGVPGGDLCNYMFHIRKRKDAV